MSARLTVRTVEKPWGVDRLPAPFATPDGKRIGEIWFDPPPALDALLVKYLFTSEKLSVQVHPDDAQTFSATRRREGKEECWLIVGCEPGAKVGIGFETAIDSETMRAAALDGSIERRIRWFDVAPGDFFYIPANTVHAIGPGCSLIEIQQNSDITYRLYDYGRPRELHLDAAVAVAKGEPHPADLRRRVAERGEIALVEGPLFRLDRLDGPPSQGVVERYSGAFLAIPVSGTIAVDDEEIEPGACALVHRWSALAVGADSQVLIAQPLAGTR